MDLLVGGSGDDTLEGYGRTAVTLRGGAAHDYVFLYYSGEPGQIANGGRGRDVLELQAAGPVTRSGTTVTIDRVTSASDPALAPAGLTSFERFTIALDSAHNLGTDAVDRVDARFSGHLRAETLGGDDHVLGTAHQDVVDGGAGSDLADLGDGHDRCVGVEQGPC